MKQPRLFIALLLLGLALAPSATLANTDDSNELEREMNRLDKINFHPTILPLVLRNADAIGLTDTQRRQIEEWRRTVAPKMIVLMEDIMQARLRFQKNSLNPEYTGDQLLAEQESILTMHQELLRKKLECRRLITESFNETQWENLYFALAAEGSFELAL